MAGPVLGIDLGTTNSSVAVASDTGDVRLIPCRGTEVSLPSVVAIGAKGEELIGYEAKRQAQLNPLQTIFGAKRILGLSAHSEIVTRMRAYAPYPIETIDGDDIVIPIAGRRFRPPEISARILAKLREIAGSALGTAVSQAVVTVPAYFNDRQRQAVHEAGRLAGLEVVRIINEPTAAAIAYSARRELHEKIAVYDLGGGTFDISVIEVRGRTLEVKSTGGDVFLGGLDFDDAVVQYILTDFQAQRGQDLRRDPVAVQRIRDMAERVKIDLSTRREVPLSIPFIAQDPKGQPINLSMIVRREELEVLVQPLVDRTFDVCAKVIEDAGLAPEQLDQVVLVGGQTRMPLIQERIKHFFGRAPAKSVHPDEAVAAGAALFAWSLGDNSDLKYQLLDVLPMAIRIGTATGGLHPLFERNAAVPNQRAFTFTTHRDNQPDVVMRLYQGDAPVARDNTPLGEFTFSGLRRGAAGSVRVEVVFDVSAEGMLALRARDLDTGTEMQQSVRFRAPDA